VVKLAFAKLDELGRLILRRLERQPVAAVWSRERGQGRARDEGATTGGDGPSRSAQNSE
jgi:hypothetical protein